MKLVISKTATLELEQLDDIGGSTRYGRQFNVQVGEDSARLSKLINNAVRSYFEMPETETETVRAAGREALAKADKIRPAIFREQDSGLLRIVYKELAVRFVDGTSAKKREKILKKFGLQVRKRGRYNSDLFLAHDPRRKIMAEKIVEASNEMMMLDEVEVASPNFVSEFSRSAPPTPSALEWHLNHRPGQSHSTASDVEIRMAWRSTLGSPQVVVAVLDDGIDVEHPNIRDNVVSRPDPNDPRDIIGRDFYISDDDHPDHFDPRPKRFQFPYDRMAGNDIHGTPCAGVALASGRLDKIFGAAPQCSLLPVKVFHADDLASEDRVADAIAYAASFSDILSCSWSGPHSALIEAVLSDAAGGRIGLRRANLGTPIFFASGNDDRDQVSYPAASAHTICVGATTDQAEIAGYSNRGPEVWVSAPSSGGVNGITTTDVGYPSRGFNVGVHAAGGADGLHTNDFGGTSSATPLVAGIAALMLSMRPNLDLDALKEILRDTADRIGPKSSYRGNPLHSNKFGYGRVNAGAALEATLRVPILTS